MTKKLCNQDLGMLVLRIAVGVVFMAHGWQKFENMASVANFFGSIGVPWAGGMAYVVAIIEFVGGLAIVLGAFTWLAGLLLAVVMLVAIFAVKGTGQLIGQGGYELELVLLAASLAIAKIHPGKYSVMRVLKKENQVV